MKPATTATSAALRCTVVGADKLPPGLGGAEAVCRAIDVAAAPVLAAHGSAAAPASVVVHVLGQHMLAATLTTGDGRRLPEQRVAASDRPLGESSLALLGKALAAQLAAKH